MGESTEYIPSAFEEIIQVLLKQFRVNFSLISLMQVSNRTVYNFSDWKVSSWNLAFASKTNFVVLAIILKCRVHVEFTRENLFGNVF